MSEKQCRVCGMLVKDGWFHVCIPAGDRRLQPEPVSLRSEPTAFKAILAEMEALHDKKQQDYGKDADPFANVRASEDFGIPGWHGCLIRANDKMRRLQTFCQKGTLANEGVEDSLLDLAVYSVIALVLWREKHQPEEKS